MKNAPFKYIQYTLNREEMHVIRAGNSCEPAAGGTHRTNGRGKEHPQSLLEAFRILSCRECEVLEKIAEGKSNREIAGELFIAKGTVENHISRMGKALGVQGRGRLREWINKQKKSK